MSSAASQRDVDRFTDAVVAQYLPGALDGHAKNYSVILDGEDVTLAPLYDEASILPYPIQPAVVALAFRCGFTPSEAAPSSAQAHRPHPLPSVHSVRRLYVLCAEIESTARFQPES